jgi:hypothetical protein
LILLAIVFGGIGHGRFNEASSQICVERRELSVSCEAAEFGSMAEALMRPGGFVGFLCGPRGGSQIGLDTLKNLSVVAEEFASGCP